MIGLGRRSLLAATISAFVGLGVSGPEALAQTPRRRGRRHSAWRAAVIERRRRNAARFETDRQGRAVLRAQVIAISPGRAGIAAMRRLGFRRLRHTVMAELQLEIIVLAAPARFNADQALNALQSADPDGAYELNHVFDPSAGAAGGETAVSPVPLVNGRGLRLGMIDGGVLLQHRCLRDASITQRGFAGQPVASAHGTAIASLLVGRGDNFGGYAPGARLLAADVFGDEVEGGAAEAVAAAINWLVGEDVQAINISLEGPPNRLLEIACRSAAARGVLLVASVGNAGPSRPVAFPAAYDSVVAATAVDARGRIYLMANRGPEVAFAARGVSVEAAMDDGAFEGVSGTSFAAPMVVAALARSRLDASSAQAAIARLAATATDAGAPGRDPVYGFGIVR